MSEPAQETVPEPKRLERSDASPDDQGIVRAPAHAKFASIKRQLPGGHTEDCLAHNASSGQWEKLFNLPLRTRDILERWGSGTYVFYYRDDVTARGSSTSTAFEDPAFPPRPARYGSPTPNTPPRVDARAKLAQLNALLGDPDLQPTVAQLGIALGRTGAPAAPPLPDPASLTGGQFGLREFLVLQDYFDTRSAKRHAEQIDMMRTTFGHAMDLERTRHKHERTEAQEHFNRILEAARQARGDDEVDELEDRLAEVEAAKNDDGSIKPKDIFNLVQTIGGQVMKHLEEKGKTPKAAT